MNLISQKLITTHIELQQAMSRLDELADQFSLGNLTNKNEFDILSLIVEEFESRHFQTEALEPHVFLNQYLENSGRTKADLTSLIGAQSRASEILSGKRELSKSQIKKIAEAWGLPLAPLFGVDIKKAA